MIRTLGASVGISVMQATLTSRGAAAHAVLAGHIETSDPTVRAALPAALDPSAPLGLELLNGEVTRQAAMIAYDLVFSYMFLTTLLFLPLLVLIRPARAVAGVHIEATHE
jgi:DHA2 family multidrug resistance protein